MLLFSVRNSSEKMQESGFSFHMTSKDVAQLASLASTSSRLVSDHGMSSYQYFLVEMGYHLISNGIVHIVLCNFYLNAIIFRTNPVQIQLRFCHLDPSCEQDDNFPKNLDLKVNGKPFPLPVCWDCHYFNNRFWIVEWVWTLVYSGRVMLMIEQIRMH